MLSITGYSGIQLNMDYVNALVCVSVSLSLCVCKYVCIFVSVYVWKIMELLKITREEVWDERTHFPICFY